MTRILVGDRTTLRFRHRTIRDALRAGLSREALSTLHGRIAEKLLEHVSNEPELDREVGHHLFLAGRRREAAPFLHAAGYRLFESQLLREAIPLLESAYDAYADDPAAGPIRGELERHLVISGAMVDREIVVRHGEAAFALAWRAAGLELGERVARYFGRPLGVLIGLLSAYVRRLFSPKTSLQPSPAQALQAAVVIAAAGVAVHAHMFQLDKMLGFVSRLKILDVFPKTILQSSYRVCIAMYELMSGNRHSTRVHCDVALSGLENDHWIPLSGYARLAAEASIRNTRSWVQLIDQDPSYESDVLAIERLNLRSFAFSCAVFRTIFHRLRGEEPLALQMEARAERIRLELGTLWMWESVLWQQSSLAYAVTRDALGLKRCVEALTRLEEGGFRVRDFTILARANYAREQGDYDTAKHLLEELVQGLPERSTLPQHVLIALAEVSLAMGSIDEAAAYATRADSLARHPDKGLRSIRLFTSRVFAWAFAHQGDTKTAFATLDTAIAEAEATNSPILAGALHEAAAYIAVKFGHPSRAERHCHATGDWFGRTGNPVLVARFERLLRTSSPRKLNSDVREGQVELRK